MTTIHCTQKLLSRLPASAGEQLLSEYSNHFADSFMDTLLKTDAEDELMELAVSRLAPILIEKSVDRSVLGTLNNIIQQVQFAIHDGEVTNADITGYRIGAWLADTPWYAKGTKGAIWT